MWCSVQLDTLCTDYMISFPWYLIWYLSPILLYDTFFLGLLNQYAFRQRVYNQRFKWCNMIAKAAVKIFNKKFCRYLTHLFVWSDKANQCLLNYPIFFTPHIQEKTRVIKFFSLLCFRFFLVNPWGWKKFITFMLMSRFKIDSNFNIL